VIGDLEWRWDMAMRIRLERRDIARRVQIVDRINREERPTQRWILTGPDQPHLARGAHGHEVELVDAGEGILKAAALCLPISRRLVHDDPSWRLLGFLSIPLEHQLKQGAGATREDILKFMDGKIAKWWMPDDIVFVDGIPHTATGKLLKTALRDQFKAYSFPNAAA